MNGTAQLSLPDALAHLNALPSLCAAAVRLQFKAGLGFLGTMGSLGMLLRLSGKGKSPPRDSGSKAREEEAERGRLARTAAFISRFKCSFD